VGWVVTVTKLAQVEVKSGRVEAPARDFPAPTVPRCTSLESTAPMSRAVQFPVQLKFS